MIDALSTVAEFSIGLAGFTGIIGAVAAGLTSNAAGFYLLGLILLLLQGAAVFSSLAVRTFRASSKD